MACISNPGGWLSAQVAPPNAPKSGSTLTGTTSRRPGSLASGELHLIGLRLQAPTQRIDVPKGSPFRIRPVLMLGDRAATLSETTQLLPAGALLRGVFTGPGLPSTELTGNPTEGFSMPPLQQEGDFQLSDIRIEKEGVRLFDAEPKIVDIHCLGDVIITSVASTPMTLDEIREAGIPLGQGNYEGKRFSLTLALGSQTVDLNLAVAIPQYNGVDEVVGSEPVVRLELGQAAGSGMSIPDLSVGVVDILPDSTLTLKRPEIAHLLRYGFKGLVVIPGSIGYLHQFFKVNLLVMNVLPGDSPYVVNDLQATALLPGGRDGAYGTADDPIRPTASQGESAALGKPILGVGANGQLGSGASSLKGGETGAATWFMEGLKEGGHLIQFRIQGEFVGGSLTGPIPITGEARGKVLVRNPKFNIMLVHPDVVRKGETYPFEVRVTNTSEALANLVTVSLDQARLGNVKVVGEAAKVIETLNPGETRSVTFQMKANRNGEVVSSYLYVEEGGGGFQLSMGLGERQVHLSPDTLVLPQTLDALPESLREAMLVVLGQAHSIATSKAALPPGVLPIRSTTLSGPIITGLNEAGLFLNMGMEKRRIWADLWRLFVQNRDPGFDQLMRTTEAGRNLRDTFLATHESWFEPGSGPGALVAPMAAWNDAGATTILGAIEGCLPGLDVVMGLPGAVFGQSGDPLPGLFVQGTALATSGGNRFLQAVMPVTGLRLALANSGTQHQDLKLTLAAPLLAPGSPPFCNRFSIRLAPGTSAFVDLGLVPGPTIQILDAARQPLATLNPETSTSITPEPFQVLAVHRYDLSLSPSATPFGTHVLVLFNRPPHFPALPAGDAGFAQASALVRVEANRLWQKVMPAGGFFGDEAIPSPAPLALQAPRILSVYLEKPVGPNIQRHLSLVGTWTSKTGDTLQGNATWPVQSGWIPGGAVVKGKLRKATGESQKGALTYWYLVAPEEGGRNLVSNGNFEDPYYALISNNIQIDEDGSFQLDYVPEAAKTALGTFTLQGDASGRRAYASADVLGNNQMLEMDLVLEGQGTVLGAVKDGQGAPRQGAIVQVIQEQPSYGRMPRPPKAWSAGTDALGEFRFEGVSTGIFSLRVKQGTLGAARSGVLPMDGDIVRQDLVLDAPTGSLTVQVKNFDGTPRPNQTVFLGLPSGLLRSGSQIQFIYPEALSTDAQGQVTFLEVPSGDVSACIGFNSPLLPTWFGFLNPGTHGTAVLQLQDRARMASVEVQVVDSLGQPVNMAGLIWVQNPAGSATAAHSDVEGKALMAAPPDKPFTVRVIHPDWPVAGVLSGTLVPGSGQALTLRIAMPPRASVRGSVKRPDGSPVVGAYVAVPPVFGAIRYNRMDRTNSKGEFRIKGLSVSTGERLAAVGAELATSANATVQGKAEQELVVNLTLPETGNNTLSGHVYQPLEGGQPIGTISIVEVFGLLPEIAAYGNPERGDGGNRNWGLPVEAFTGTFLTRTDGAYQISGLPPGPFRVKARADLFPTWVEAAGVFEGSRDAASRDLYLLGLNLASLEGQVFLPDGFSKAGQGLRVRLGTPNVSPFREVVSVETQPDGRYAFAKVLNPGNYWIRVEDPRTGARSVTAVLLVKDQHCIKNVRLWGSGTLRVKALDSQGQPLSEGALTLSHAQRGLMEATDLPDLTAKLMPSNLGQWSFEGLWEGPVGVVLKNPQGRTGVASATLPQGGGDAEVSIRLQPVGGIRGLLKRADGTLVGAGRVDAYQGGSWLGVSPTRQEGEDGRFLFQGLPLGAIHLEAWDPDSRQLGRGTVQVSENGIAELTITLQDQGSATVSVTQEGLPIDRATVNLRYLGGGALAFSAEATTDSAGTARFQIPPGNYSLDATDPVSLSTGSLAFERLNNQGPMTLTLALRPTRDLRVQVLAPPGWTGPLTGWKLGSNTGRTAILGADGRALLPQMAVGSYTLNLRDLVGRHRGQRVAILSAEAGAIQELELQALARGAARVTVQDANGALLPAVRVTKQILPGESGLLNSIDTDPQGQVSFEGILQGVHGITATTQDGRQSARGSVTLAAEGETEQTTLTFGPTAGFRGILKDGAGQPAPFVEVKHHTYLYPYTFTASLGTDAEGRFEATGLPFGTYTLTATTGPNRSGSRQVVLDVADAVVNADFSTGAAGQIRGIVKDPLRSMVPAVTLGLFDGNARVATASVDTGGGFILRDVPANRDLRLRATLDDGLTQALDQPLRLTQDGEILSLEVTLLPRPHLTGHTYASDGSTARSMVLKLYPVPGSTPIRTASTSADHPTFQMNYLVPGNYALYGYDDATLIAYATFAVGSVAEFETRDLIAAPIRDLKLQVRYPDGTPLQAPGAVTLNQVAAPYQVWRGNLAQDGSLLLRNLPLGDLRISAAGIPNQPVLQTATTLVDGSGAQDLALPAWGVGTISAKVQTASGRVLQGTKLTVRTVENAAIGWLATPQSDGSYLAQGVWISKPLTFTAEGFGPVGSAPTFRLAAHGESQSVIYPVPDQGSVQGTVNDFKGLPVAGAIVAIGVRASSTDAHGRFRLDGLGLGSHQLLATVPGRPHRGLQTFSLDVDGGVAEVVVALLGTGTVKVRAATALGIPLANQTVSLTNTGPASDGKAMTASTDAAGLASFANVLEGPLSAAATLLGTSRNATGSLLAEGSLDLALSAAPVQVTVLPRNAYLYPSEGRTFTAQVANALDAKVTWALQEGAPGGSLDDQGRYLAPATPGTYHVVATSQADPAASSAATVTVMATEALRPILSLPLDEGAGTLTADASGQGIAAALSGTPTWVEGHFGKALSFAGAATVLLTPVVKLPAAWTLSAWFQAPLPATGTYHTLTRGSTADHQILVAPDQVSLGSWQSAANKFWDSGFRLNTLSAGWHHVAAVGLAGTTRFYVDGRAVGNAIHWQSLSDLYSVGNYQGGGQSFGLLDEVRVYGQAFGPSAVAGLFEGTVMVCVSPATLQLAAGASRTFIASVGNSTDARVIWSLPDAASGSITADGVYTAPAAPGVYTVTATSHVDPTRSATARVVVTLDGVLDVSGTWTDSYNQVFTLFQEGGDVWGTRGVQRFEATLNGATLTGVQRDAQGAITINFVWTFAADGNSYSGKWANGTGTPVTSWTGSRQTGVVTVSLSPSSQPILLPGGSQSFRAFVAGTPDRRVVWNASGGTVTGSGVFTAPAIPGQNRYVITATSVAEPTRFATGSVLTAPGGIAFISGAYTHAGGIAVFYQDGTAISGDLTYSTYKYTFQGTLNGYALSGTTTRNDGFQQILTVTFNADLTAFSGTWGGGAWSGTRKVGEVVVRMSPNAPRILKPGEQVQYTTDVAGTFDKAVTLTSTDNAVDPNGLYTAPSGKDYTAQTITASAHVDPTRKASAQVSLTPTGILEVSGTYTDGYFQTFTLFQNGTRVHGTRGGNGFEATLSGYVLTGVQQNPGAPIIFNFTWTFAPDTQSFSGLWAYGTAAPSNPWTGTRIPGVTVELSPNIKSLTIGETCTFTTQVAGSPNKGVEWSASAGTITAEGVFTPPSTAGTVTITAKSLADPAKTATAKVLVTDGNPAASLVAHWKFEEGSGTVAQDASTNALNGTLTNAPTWIEGRAGQGKALQFNGFTSTLDVPDHTKLNPQSLSLGMWLYLSSDPNCSTGDNWRSLIHKGAVAAGGSGYSVQLGEHRVLNFDTGTGAVDRWLPAGVVIPIGKWTHVVLTFDASTGLKQAFQDGVLKDSKLGTAAPLASNTSPFIVNHAAASACTAGNGHFDGAMDDLRIYSRILSPSEVTALFAPLTISPATLSMKPGATTTFVASRTDGREAPITWAATGGTIGTDGTFTAPSTPGLYSITATSNLDPTLPAVSMVDVRDFDAAEDFNLSANPNGAWSYGWTATLGGAFTPYVNHAVAANGLESWTTSGTPGITRNPTLNNVTSANVTLTPNQLSMHPGSAGQYSVLRWKALEAGSVEVSAAFLGADSQPTTTDVHVLLNGVSKFDGMVDAFHVGPSYHVTLAVQVGDTLDVAVGYGNGNYNYDSTGVQFRINKVPPPPATAQSDTTRESRIPAQAALRLRFEDKHGNPLPEDLPGDRLILEGEQGRSIELSHLVHVLLPDLFAEGPHRLRLRSERWGELPDITFRVAPTDHGKTLERSVKLPWVRTNLEVKVLAGDRETPVPGAVVSLSMGGKTLELARIPEGVIDTEAISASLFSPEATDLRLEASFPPRRKAAPVTVHLDPRPTGGTLQATLVLPLTVLRTRLTDTDGTDLEEQGLDAKASGEKGEPDPEPTASINGLRYGLVLGEAAGSTLALRMYDPASGLGILQRATVPALGTTGEVAARLAPHAWLTSAVLTSAPNAPYLLVALGRGAPDLVKPEAASWLQGPSGLGPLRLSVTMSEEGLAADLGSRPAAGIPDPDNPPQPELAWMPKVRIPLAAEVWVAAWTLLAEDQGDGTVDLWPRLEPFGRGTLAASENQEVTASASPVTLNWKQRTLRVLDPQHRPRKGQAVEVWSQEAPASWQIETHEALSDEEGLVTVTVPVGPKLVAQSLEPESGSGSWNYAVVEFLADDASSSGPPLLIPKEIRNLPPDPLALPREQPMLAKKRGRRKPGRLRIRKAGVR